MAVVPFFVPRAPVPRVVSYAFAFVASIGIKPRPVPGRTDPKDRLLEGAAAGDASPTWLPLATPPPKNDEILAAAPLPPGPVCRPRSGVRRCAPPAARSGWPR